jgi:hypothetical protein
VTLNVVALEPRRYIVGTGDDGYYQARDEADEIGVLADARWPWPKTYPVTARVVATCGGAPALHAEFSRRVLQRLTPDDGIEAVEAVVPDVIEELGALDPQGYVELPFGVFQRGSVARDFSLGLSGFCRDGGVRFVRCLNGAVTASDDTRLTAGLPYGVEAEELAPLLAPGYTSGLQDAFLKVVSVHERLHARRPDRVPPGMHGLVIHYRGRELPLVATFSLDARDDANLRAILDTIAAAEAREILAPLLCSPGARWSRELDLWKEHGVDA